MQNVCNFIIIGIKNDSQLYIHDFSDASSKDNEKNLKDGVFLKNINEICKTIKLKNNEILNAISQMDKNADPTTNIEIGDQIKLLIYFENIIYLLKKVYEEEDNLYIKEKISTRSLKSFSVDQSNNNILIYEQNKNENRKSDCEICAQIMSDIIDQYKQIDRKDNSNSDFFNELTDIIKTNFNKKLTEIDYSSILSTLSKKKDVLYRQLYIRKARTENYFSYLINISKNKAHYQNSTILNIIDTISKIYEPYVGTSPVIKSFQEIMNIYYKKDVKFNSLDQTASIPNQKKIYDFLTDISKNGKFYLFDYFFQNLIKNILDQEQIQSKHENSNNTDSMMLINDAIQFNENSAVFKLFYTQDLYYYIQKEYKTNDDPSREQEILSQNLSKFIVSCNKIQKDSNNNSTAKYFIPYYPNGTVSGLIKNLNKLKLRKSLDTKKQDRVIKLNNVDKFVILLEIATALDNLHKKNYFHGILSDDRIYISSNLDAYIGSFHYSENSMPSVTKSDICFLTPEFIEKYLVEKTNEKPEFKELNDIYSFGILAYEISTETIPDSLINDKDRDAKIEILINSFDKYLFSPKQSIKLDKKTTDLRGDSFDGLKEIIEKCIKKNPNERIKSMEKIIEKLKELPIYKNNKDEIDYRLDKAVSGKDYRCKLSNIVEAYYRGLDTFYSVLDIFFKKYYEEKPQENEIPAFKFEKDLIIDILEFFQFHINNEKNNMEEYFYEKSNNYYKMDAFYMNERWSFLFNRARYHFYQTSKDLNDNLNSVLNYYHIDWKDSFQIFRNNYYKIEDKSDIFIDQIQLIENFFYTDIFYQTLINDLLDPSLFIFNFREYLNERFANNDEAFFCIRDISQYDDLNKSCKLCCDSNMVFYMLESTDDVSTKSLEKIKDIKNYRQDLVFRIDDKYDKFDLIEEKKDIKNYRQDKVFRTDDKYDKFNLIGKNEDTEQKKKKKKLIRPYFPLGTLNNFIKSKIFELSNIEKIKIILEIAMSLNELHSYNNHYHGYLSDRSIFISSKRDAYLDLVYYENENNEIKTTDYYRAPEYFNNLNEIRINDTKGQQSSDIYSFGIIMHEIATNCTPEERMKNYEPNEIKKILKENYKEFLFEGRYKEFFLERTKDLNGDSLKGLDEIILRCIDQTQRFSNIDEIIKQIKQLPIYKEKEKEIEYKIENSVKISDYHCNISDLVYCYYYYQGKNCYEDIEKFLCLCKGIFTNNFSSSTFKINGDIIENIYNVFGIDLNIRCSANKKLSELIIKVINHNKLSSNDIFNLFDEIVEIYGKYVGDLFKTSTIEEFIKIYSEENNYNLPKEASIQETFINVFNEAQNQGKYFYILILFNSLISNLINLEKLINQYHIVFEKNNKDLNILQVVRDTLRFSEVNSTYKLHNDSELNFYLQKTFNQNVDIEKMNREKNLLSKSLSKYIVYFDKYKPTEFENKIFIPYFPLGTLEYLISNMEQNIIENNNINIIRNVRIINTNEIKPKIKLNDADKLTFILEIAIALKDLHSNHEYHGNLSDQFIYINSKRDVYIGGFCFDIKLEADVTKPRGSFYYRPPEIFTDPKPENDEDLFNLYKSADIYAFGVLTHEIFTEKTPCLRMGNLPRNDRLKLLTGDYKSFLFQGKNNEFFEKEAKIPNEKTLKEIIEKCLSKNPKDRFLKMDEIINCIHKLPIYEKNKTEVEYRLNHSINSKDYKCTLSDIIISYFQSQDNCYDDIDKFLEQYQRIYVKDQQIQTKIVGDMIQNIFSKFKIKPIINIDILNSFNDIFDLIIQLYLDKFVNHSLTFDNDNKLLLLSLKFNNRIENVSEIDSTFSFYNPNLFYFIVPISTLANFIKNNEDKIDDLIPTWILIITKELQYIHSKNLYHGSLSMNNIGIYYNTKSGNFVPSIILFYSFYQLTKEKEIKKQSINLNNSNHQNIQYYQNKDIKNLIKIIDEFGFIPNNIIDGLYDLLSINSIYSTLNNYIKSNLTDEKEKILSDCFVNTKSYSSYQVNFSILTKLFITGQNIFNLEGSFIKINEIIKLIYNFVDNISKNPQKESILKNIFLIYEKMKEKEKDSIETESNIEKQCEEIIKKCSDIIKEKDKDIKDHQNEKNYKNSEPKLERKFIMSDFSLMKRKGYYKKTDNLSTKYVFRNFTLTNFCRKSLYFLLVRYILNLHPDLKFRITIQLNHKNDFNFREEKFIPIDEVKRIAELFDRIKQVPFINDDSNIVIYVEKDTE